MSAPIEMRYQTFPPSPALADYVEHLWMVEAPAHAVPHREILIPNGRPTILVCVAAPGSRIAIRDNRIEPNVSNCAGVPTRPIILEQAGVSHYVAAQLRPWGLKAVGLPPLIDAALPMATWLGEAATSALETACGTHGFGVDATRPLQEMLSGHLDPLPPHRLSLLRSTMDAVESKGGLIGVEALTEHLGISYDALYRLFRGYVGVPVKQFLSIMRFYHFSGELLKGGYGSFALLASLQGYYDQAHATREFRRFTGISQTEFREHLNGIARLMHGDA